MFAFLWLGLGITALFLFGQRTSKWSTRFKSPELAKQWMYQVITLTIAAGLVLVNRITNDSAKDYIQLGNIGATTKLLSWLGFEGSTWNEIGITFTVIPLIVTVIVVYLQVLKKKYWDLKSLALAIALALPLAVLNSLTEELIFRIIPIEGLPFTAITVAIICAIAFGLPHYFGTPGKVIGVLMAGFLGYVAACSVLETHGIAWAWLIHFVQDVPIIAMLLI